MNENIMKQTRSGFGEMSERDQEIQASIWALMLMLGEMALSLRVLRDRLIEKGALGPEEEEILNGAASNESNLRIVYAHIEQVFLDKFSRVKTSLSNPGGVEALMQKESRDPHGEAVEEVVDSPFIHQPPTKKGDD